MKKAFTIALKYFKYYLLVLTIVIIFLLVADNWNYYKKYWNIRWFDYLKTWSTWLILYAFLYSILYWLVATVVIIVYYKIIKPLQNREKA